MAYTPDSRITQRGKAAVEGIHGTIDLVVYPTAQSANLSQQYEEEVVKDEGGFDAAWLARNHHYLSNFKFKALGDTAAHALTGLTFIAPLATVTLTDFITDLNGTWQNVSGATIDLNNTTVADFALNFRRYADSTQNTSANTEPA